MYQHTVTAVIMWQGAFEYSTSTGGWPTKNTEKIEKSDEAAVTVVPIAKRITR